MKTRSFFILALLCLLVFTVTAQAQQLDKKISIQVKEATLPQVLQKIQQKYAIRFSYLNNALPAKQRFSADITDKPLSEVLDVLLSQTDMGYLERNGQVIIKQGLPKKEPKAITLKNVPAAVPAPKPASKNNTVFETKVTTTVKPDGTIDNKVETKTKPAEPVLAAPETVNTPATAETTPELGKTEELLAPVPKPNTPSYDDDNNEMKAQHFGIIYPLSTNGIHANLYVNKVSAHLLIGTAAGLQGFEFSGIGNVEQQYVHGLQFAGIFNISKNLNNNSEVSLRGGQFAGLVNISKGNSSGVQSAGLLNVTKNLNGAQLNGFMNKAKQVYGVQIAGFLNHARSVRGTQIGFINITDSISGVPIGLINIVKKNGYRRLEAYHADDFDVNLTYKIGVRKFYNMIAVGAQTGGSNYWGYGAGFGAEWRLTKWFHVNTDLMSYYVIDQNYKTFPDGLFENYHLNLLNKFRLLGSLQLSNRLALFGGPTYNVFVTDNATNLVNHTLHDRTNFNGTNVQMWVGFNAGIRF
ncbi:FecR domain-containing protein [Adhaeribacter aquaticus]|uniref:FecR domain-containing protein n=1 Tax=Adhaeribacter aquaticus TaxID=299567 RepID=UPI000408429D|nr:FecR domain-containing protein [Adhaeribacter aquaticus]